MIYVVAYDITDPKRLSRVAKYLENIGVRVQESIFELDNSIDNIVISKIFDNLVKLCKKADKIFIYKVKEKQDMQLDTDNWDMVL